MRNAQPWGCFCLRKPPLFSMLSRVMNSYSVGSSNTGQLHHLPLLSSGCGLPGVLRSNFQEFNACYYPASHCSYPKGKANPPSAQLQQHLCKLIILLPYTLGNHISFSCPLIACCKVKCLVTLPQSIFLFLAAFRNIKNTDSWHSQNNCYSLCNSVPWGRKSHDHPFKDRIVSKKCFDCNWKAPLQGCKCIGDFHPCCHFIKNLGNNSEWAGPVIFLSVKKQMQSLVYHSVFHIILHWPLPQGL